MANRYPLSPEYDEIPVESNDKLEVNDGSEEIPDEKKEELVEILKRPYLLSFIDEALYERAPDDGFIIGEVESKHTLNFNCVGARLGLSTINTLKGPSSIGKTNTANVITGFYRTKKVDSLQIQPLSMLMTFTILTFFTSRKFWKKSSKIRKPG